MLKFHLVAFHWNPQYEDQVMEATIRLEKQNKPNRENVKI